MEDQKSQFTILGQDVEVIIAVFSNILSWFIRKFLPFLLPRLLPKIEEEDTSENPSPTQTRCIAIARPGGSEQLRIIVLKNGYATAGYNVGNCFIDISGEIPKDTVVVKIAAFSINFADCELNLFGAFDRHGIQSYIIYCSNFHCFDHQVLFDGVYVLCFTIVQNST
jgi:hypothetical protein